MCRIILKGYKTKGYKTKGKKNVKQSVTYLTVDTNILFSVFYLHDLNSVA